MTALESVTAKIQAAVPDTVEHWKAHVCGKLCGCKCKPEDLEDRMTTRPITLEDCMIASEKGTGITVDSDGCINGILRKMQQGHTIRRRCLYLGSLLD
jgi:hypothetical protein